MIAAGWFGNYSAYMYSNIVTPSACVTIFLCRLQTSYSYRFVCHGLKNPSFDGKQLFLHSWNLSTHGFFEPAWQEMCCVLTLKRAVQLLVAFVSAIQVLNVTGFWISQSFAVAPWSSISFVHRMVLLVKNMHLMLFRFFKKAIKPCALVTRII